MKKRQLFTLALLGATVMFTSSCSDDEEDAPLGPTLTMIETNSGSTGGAIEITQGEALEFAWESRKGDNNIQTFSLVQSGSNTSTWNETYEGNTLPYSVSGGDRSIYIDTIAFVNSSANEGTTTYAFTSSDGVTSKTVTFNVTVVENVNETPLSAAEDFEWERVGGSAGTGLAAFGLQWTSNSGTSAIVAIQSGTVMVELPSSSWTSITTREELAAAIASGTEIDSYQGVSATASGLYDDVLAVSHDGVDYLLRINAADVTTGGSGTTITIQGQYKN